MVRSVTTAILDSAEAITDFLPALQVAINVAHVKSTSAARVEIQDLMRTMAKTEKSLARWQAVIEDGTMEQTAQTAIARMRELESTKASTLYRLEVLKDSLDSGKPAFEARELPNAIQAAMSLEDTSVSFYEAMKQLVPHVVMYPYRLAGRAKASPHIVADVDLSSLLPDLPEGNQAAGALKTRHLLVSEKAYSYAIHALKVFELCRDGLPPRHAASRLTNVRTGKPYTEPWGLAAFRHGTLLHKVGLNRLYSPIPTPQQVRCRNIKKRLTHPSYEFSRVSGWPIWDGTIPGPFASVHYPDGLADSRADAEGVREYLEHPEIRR